MRRLILCLVAMVLTSAANGVAAQVSSGTAFSVAPQLLITNQHVIAGCTSIEVIAEDGRRAGSVVDADAQIDLALLRVSGIKGATARLRNPRNVRLGESVMVFGFPLTGSLTSGGNFTSGLVSGLRGLRDAAGEIQITAPVQPGNSGGPLMDASGLVIGVVQAKLDALRSAIATGDIPQNVNFAISLEVLADYLTRNKVPFRDGAISSRLDTDRAAEMAQSFTYRVECRGRSRQAGASSGMEPKPPETVLPVNPPVAGTAVFSALDRRTIGVKVDDDGIELRATNRVSERFGDRVHVNITSYNRSVLVTGEVPDAKAKAEIEKLIQGVPAVRSITNDLKFIGGASLSSRASDATITGNVRARLLDAGKLNPFYVKVITDASAVYLLGIVTEAEAGVAVEVARTTGGVRKVVKVFEYCNDTHEVCRPR